MSVLDSNLYSDIECLGNAEGFLDEILECVDAISLFEGMDADELKVLCHYMQCYAAPRDYVLFEEGSGGDFLMLVLTGGVDLYKKHPDQNLKQITEVGIGECLGQLSFLDGQTRYATCITKVPTDFAVMTRESLNEILVHYPRLANKFLLVLLQLMAKRMRESSYNL